MPLYCPDNSGMLSGCYRNMHTDNIIYTPHVAWNSVEAETELRKSSAQEVKRVLKGEKPINLVNKEVLKYY